MLDRSIDRRPAALPVALPALRRRLSAAVLIPVLSGPLLGGSIAAAGELDTLPVERITLYRSGVGAFERRGVVIDDEDVQLTIAADLVNDILKSMVLLDLSGGRIESASYGSREPLERRLASFAVDLSDAPGRAELLSRLRGTMVRLKMADGEVEGRVLSVETATVPVGDGTSSLVHVTLATTAGGIESVRLDHVRAFEILDAKVRDEIARALAAIAEQRSERVKTIDLAFRGDGQRQVAVSYVHEMPVWKTSYRLVLPEEGEADARPFVQGWAIVENVTDEDWADVRLELVAGRPVSFVMDLYEPLFLPRPTLPVPIEMAARPRSYAPGDPRTATAVTRGGGPESSQGRVAAMAGAPTMEMADSARGSGMAKISAGQMINMSAAARAAAEEAGSVFRYTLDTPVTIERRRSAMLPILGERMEGRRVSIHDVNSGSPHPMRGYELENVTDLQLMPGPIAVYDGGSFAGDASIDFVAAGDERLLSFAMDLEVRVKTDSDQRRRVRRVRIVDGMVEVMVGVEQQVEHEVANDDEGEDRTVLIEVPDMSGWKLEGAEPVEDTASSLRFEVGVAAGDTKTLRYTWTRTDYSRVSATQYDLGTLLTYERQGLASDDVVAAVRRARELQQQLNAAEALVARLEQERREIVNDQSRLRENLARVGNDTRLGERYLAKLDEQETRLEELETETAQARREVQQRRNALEQYLRDLDVN